MLLAAFFAAAGWNGAVDAAPEMIALSGRFLLGQSALGTHAPRKSGPLVKRMVAAVVQTHLVLLAPLLPDCLLFGLDCVQLPEFLPIVEGRIEEFAKRIEKCCQDHDGDQRNQQKEEPLFHRANSLKDLQHTITEPFPLIVCF